MTNTTFTIYDVGVTSAQRHSSTPVTRVREQYSTESAAIARVLDPEYRQTLGADANTFLTVNVTTYTPSDDGTITTTTESLWGRRETPDGNVGEGYLDLRDIKADPEYAEFLRLAAKFEGA